MKNKKIIILIIMITVLLTGCSNNQKEEYINKNNDRFIIVYNDLNKSIYVDKETCVEYIFTYKSGGSVIYNSDSSVKINEECVKNYE